jgi:nucleotide-binding universal stress UspA family protein
VSPLQYPLLAYDGSAKAEEALYVATYLAARWQRPLTVVTVITEHTPPEALDIARAYLETRNVRATHILEEGPIAESILRRAESEGSDFVIMGGYGYGPVREAVLGSAVDGVLRASKHPILICR